MLCPLSGVPLESGSKMGKMSAYTYPRGNYWGPAPELKWGTELGKELWCSRRLLSLQGKAEQFGDFHIVRNCQPTHWAQVEFKRGTIVLQLAASKLGSRLLPWFGMQPSRYQLVIFKVQSNCMNKMPAWHFRLLPFDYTSVLQVCWPRHLQAKALPSTKDPGRSGLPESSTCSASLEAPLIYGQLASDSALHAPDFVMSPVKLSTSTLRASFLSGKKPAPSQSKGVSFCRTLYHIRIGQHPHSIF